MSTTGVSPSTVIATGDPAARERSRAQRFTTLVASHSVTDFLSFVIIPLMSVLEGRASFGPKQGALLLGLGSISSGLIQPVVAYYSDKLDTRWLATLGLSLAAVAIGLVGFAHSFEHLLILQALGAAGIGAFHPVATAAAGQLSTVRTRGISIFYAAGMFGTVAAGWIVPALGVSRTVLFILPGLIMAAALSRAIHSIPHRHATAHADHAALPEAERRRRWIEVGLLYCANVVRFMVNMMLIQLIIRWTERWVLTRAGALELTDTLRVQATGINGPVQGAMSIGMGAASLMIGWFATIRMEKRLLLLIPVAGAAAIAALPFSGAVWIAFGLAIVAGVGYQGVMPIVLTMAQRLLPHRTSLASGLMLGGAWAIAAAGPPLAQALCDRVGLNTAFECVAGLLLMSVVLTIPLRSAGRG